MFRRRIRKGRYRVAIEGFSDVERAALASFFRLTERRVPGYLRVATPDDSDFLIADADQPRVLAWIARERRIGETVFIGEQAPDAALAWLTRPIDSGSLMRALDSLLGGWTGAESQAALDSQDIAGGDAASAQNAEPTRNADLAASMAATTTADSNAREASSGIADAGRKVLVAAEATHARDVLLQRLVGLGYRVSVAGSSDEALDYAAWTAFAIAFVDLDVRVGGGLDGMQLCQQLKRYDGADALAVVVTTGGRGGATDRVRAALAGCDVYLSKPLGDADLADVLRQVDPSFVGSSGATR